MNNDIYLGDIYLGDIYLGDNIKEESLFNGKIITSLHNNYIFT